MEPLCVFLGRNKLTSDKGEKLCIWIWVQAQLARAQFYEADILYGQQFVEMVRASLHRVLRMLQIWVCTSRSWISPQQTQMVGAALMKKICALKKREESSTGLSSKNECTKTPDIFFLPGSQRGTTSFSSGWRICLWLCHQQVPPHAIWPTICLGHRLLCN